MADGPSVDLGRPFDPSKECRTLDDYRRRYARYRREPELQALRRALPMIATLDDHELADGAWAGGSSKHREAEHGPWSARRDAALQARWEWLPARPPDPSDLTRVFRTISLGDLASIQLLDIRSRRDEPVPSPAMDDPARTMLGAEQRAWLLGALAEAARQVSWQIVATPSIFTRTWSEDPTEPLRTALAKLSLSSRNLDDRLGVSNRDPAATDAEDAFVAPSPTSRGASSPPTATSSSMSTTSGSAVSGGTSTHRPSGPTESGAALPSRCGRGCRRSSPSTDSVVARTRPSPDETGRRPRRGSGRAAVAVSGQPVAST